jgi:radical SAM family uncharacterized protein
LNQILEQALRRVQKPGRYTGGELNGVVKDRQSVDVRFAFCFPDTYEIGMSHLGMKILYGLLNKIPDVWCERVFAPWVDFEEQMRQNAIPLYGLESGDPIRDFDLIGFTLQYEMSYTNVLNMLDLAGVPLHTADRMDSLAPVVIAGGPCACNPEPLADFIDLFALGEGEEVICEVVDLYKECRRAGRNKRAFLLAAAQIPGVYVPSLYDVSYHEDGTLRSVTPAAPGVPATVTKRIIRDLDRLYYPENFVVPFMSIVHDRAMLEVFRGCIRGCRFCQAGFIYRPVREKGPSALDRQAHSLCEGTGYEEISLSSLSTSDYTELEPLLTRLLGWTPEKNVSLSLPSLRVDNFPRELMEKIQSVRKSSLTFAPEAGTQRLRDTINKNINEEELIQTCRTAFSGGWTSVKLYFMLGLPTETDDDVEGIIRLAQKVVDTYYALPEHPKGKAVQVTVSVATFVPKPFTPFQWEAQDDGETILRKQKLLLNAKKSRKITVHCHESRTSYLEAVLAKGDRRLGAVLEAAWRRGCKLDSWSECFDYDRWMEAFRRTGVDPAFYALRRRGEDEAFPWDHLDFGVDRAFLLRENRRAHQSVSSPNCRQQCLGCGAAKLTGGVCSVHSGASGQSPLR